MWRLYFLVFHGETRAAKDVLDHVHEPAPVVTIPLIVLAVLSALGGVLGIPQLFGDWFGIEHSHSLANFLSPVWPAAEPHHLDARDRARAHAARRSAIAVLGCAASRAASTSRGPSCPRGSRRALAALYALLANKYYVDELYDARDRAPARARLRRGAVPRHRRGR